MVVQVPTPATNLQAVGAGTLYVFVDGSPVEVGASAATVNGVAAAAFTYTATVAGTVTTPLPAPFEAIDPVAWFDVHLGGSAVSVADQVGGTAATLGPNATTGEAADPRYLAAGDAPYIFLPGVIASYLNRADVAAIDVTGDLELRIRIAPDSWGAFRRLIGSNGFGSSSYWWEVNSDGEQVLNWHDGTTTHALTATAANGITDGDVMWLRVTLDVDNGASGHTATFYKSTDGSSWTQVGDPVTDTGTTQIRNSSSILEVGSLSFGGSVSTPARYYQARVYNGIGGTLVTHMDPSSIAGSATSITDSGTAGGSYNIDHNTSATVLKPVIVVDRSTLVADGSNDYIQVPSGAVPAMGATDDWSVVWVGRILYTPSSDACLFDSNVSGGGNGPFLRVQTSGTTANLVAQLADGTSTVTTGDAAYTARQRVAVAVICRNSGDELAISVNGGTEATVDVSALGSRTAAGTARWMGRLAGTNFLSAETTALMTVDRALTSTEVGDIVAYYED